MKKNKRIIFIITCFVFVMSYSSLSGTAGFNRQLNVLVDENNLSYEDIKVNIRSKSDRKYKIR